MSGDETYSVFNEDVVSDDADAAGAADGGADRAAEPPDEVLVNGCVQPTLAMAPGIQMMIAPSSRTDEPR